MHGSARNYFFLYATRAQIVVRLVLEPKWQQTRGSPKKLYTFSGPDPEVFTPPVVTFARRVTKRVFLQGSERKARASALEEDEHHCSRSRLPQAERRVAPRIPWAKGRPLQALLPPFGQGSPLAGWLLLLVVLLHFLLFC